MSSSKCHNFQAISIPNIPQCGSDRGEEGEEELGRGSVFRLRAFMEEKSFSFGRLLVTRTRATHRQPMMSHGRTALTA